jgi:hypothetical protein
MRMRDEIDSCKWIYLRELGEPEQNSLRLVIEEAKADGPHEDIEVLPGKVLTGMRTIESDWTCRAFELVWPTYVAYSVRNESYCIGDNTEQWEGRLFRLYSRSHFLEYVARATVVLNSGTLRLWGIQCLDHVVDVVSTDEPQIRCMKHSESGAARDRGSD